MPFARHSLSPRRPRRAVRWVAGAVGLGVIGTAALVAALPAGAYTAGNDNVVLSATGVSDGNCTASLGGSAVYLKPGDNLSLSASLLGVTVNGSALTALLAPLTTPIVEISFAGGAAQPVSTSAANPTVIRGLTPGDHNFSFQIEGVNLLGAKLTLGFTGQAAAAKATLSYSGVVHVTSAAAQCGVSVQVPGVSVSASVTGLPPIKVAIPPLALPTLTVPALPGTGITTTPPTTGASAPAGSVSGGGVTYTQPGMTVPDQVVPQGSGGGGLGGAYGSALGGGSYGSVLGLPSGSSGVNAITNGTPKTAAKTSKQVDLSSNKLPTAQMPVLLAILAIAALALVSGSYARLYLLRRTSS